MTEPASPQETADRAEVLSFGEGRSIPGQLPGDRIAWKATPEETRGAYSLQEFSTAPGGPGVAPHVHRGEEEAIYILEGEITFEVGTVVVPARAGTFILVPRGVVHSHRNTGNTPARWLTIFSPPDMGHYFEERADLRRTHPAPDDLADFAGLDPTRHAELAAKYHLEFVGPHEQGAPLPAENPRHGG